MPAPLEPAEKARRGFVAFRRLSAVIRYWCQAVAVVLKHLDACLGDLAGLNDPPRLEPLENGPKKQAAPTGHDPAAAAPTGHDANGTGTDASAPDATLSDPNNPPVAAA